jgi:membrane associated rhomboid family serine protease
MIPLRDINPTKRVPVITIILIAINVVVFLYEQTLSARGFQRFVLTYGVTPRSFTDGLITANDALTVITSMFIHDGWLHIGGNMLYLWIFGNNIEDRLGMLRFVIFYFLGGFAAAGLQIFIDPTSRIPMIGASGAIAAVLGAYIVLFPRARVQTLIFVFIFIQVVNVPAAILLGWWFLLQLFNAFVSVGGSGGVAFFAHIGGFIAGALLIRLFTVGRRPDDWWRPPPTNWSPPTSPSVPPSSDRWWE